jgi:hypothetical protein
MQLEWTVTREDPSELIVSKVRHSHSVRIVNKRTCIGLNEKGDYYYC